MDPKRRLVSAPKLEPNSVAAVAQAQKVKR